jgi:hypothetical protein
LSHAGVYTLRLVATSNAGKHSFGVTRLTIDHTAPSDTKIEISTHDVAAAHVDLSSLSVAVCVRESATTVRLSWPLVHDSESGVREYQLGTMVNGTTSWSNVGAVRSLEIPVAANLSTAYALQACNGAGLCNTSSWSRPVSRVAGPPSGGTRPKISPTHGATIGYLGLPAVVGEWGLMDAGSDASSVAYEVCVGTSPLGCQMLDFERVADGVSTWSDTGGVLSLQCGATYHLSVRATNCAGLQRVVASEGAKLCCDNPSVGTVTLQTAGGEPTAYASSIEGMIVTWQGFKEPCSGVRDYQLFVIDDSSGLILWSSGIVNASSSLVLPAAANAPLSHAGVYTLRLVATSNAGTNSTSHTAVVMDKTPPNVDLVIDGANSPVDLSCVPSASVPGCTWSGISDDESEVQTVEWAVGTQPLYSDVQPFSSVSVGTTYASMDEAPELGADVYLFCTLRVTNSAGLNTTLSSDGARLVDAQCTDELPITCAESLSAVSS